MLIFRLCALITIACISGAYFLFQEWRFASVGFHSWGTIANAIERERTHEGSVAFVGDLLLGRAVERIMERTSRDFPFQKIDSIIPQGVPIVANFEAAIPREHQETPDFEMEFSVRQDYLALLHKYNIRTLSFANNHSFDFGEEALLHAQSACAFYSISCFGHPSTLGEYSIEYVTLKDTRVGILALHALPKDIDWISLGALLQMLSSYSDVQILFVHWGEEYELVHNSAQEWLAKQAIDHGVDAVLGHHPHVIQDIGFYKGKPIFYSLGNFIFDQYFDEEVEKGLAVILEIYEETLRYELRGFTSTDSKSQPRRMEHEEEQMLFSDIAKRSSEEIRSMIKSGRIEVLREDLQD